MSVPAQFLMVPFVFDLMFYIKAVEGYTLYFQLIMATVPYFIYSYKMLTT